MKLRAVLERLRREALTAPKHIFEAGRLRQPALRAHPDVASVLATLDDAAKPTYPAREALTHALVVEHRTSGSALWASMLLVAFCPMLTRLRGRLVSNTVAGYELDQLVVTAFLAALAELPERMDRLAMRLRQRTQRRVFAFLRKEREQHRLDTNVEKAVNPDMLTPRRSSDKLYDLTLLLRHADEVGISPGGLEIVEATVLRRELLRTYVARLEPEDEAARERLYQRLKRQRSRALRKLRTLLASPVSLASGF